MLHSLEGTAQMLCAMEDNNTWVHKGCMVQQMETSSTDTLQIMQ